MAVRRRFTHFFTIRGQMTVDSAGNPASAIEHVVHRSNDVNTATGFTIHEHNHFTVKYDFIRNTVALSGAINIAQRAGRGSVIHTSGHKVIDLMTGEPIFISGPEKADDIDFCRREHLRRPALVSPRGASRHSHSVLS